MLLFMRGMYKNKSEILPSSSAAVILFAVASGRYGVPIRPASTRALRISVVPRGRSHVHDRSGRASPADGVYEGDVLRLRN